MIKERLEPGSYGLVRVRFETEVAEELVRYEKDPARFVFRPHVVDWCQHNLKFFDVIRESEYRRWGDFFYPVFYFEDEGDLAKFMLRFG